MNGCKGKTFLGRIEGKMMKHKNSMQLETCHHIIKRQNGERRRVR